MKSIPFNAGPYKFHGLPGLIAELKDDQDNFHFQLVKSENYPNSKDAVIVKPFPVFTSVNEAQYKKKKLNIYDDPLAFIKTTAINFENTEGIYLSDGTLLKPDNIREVRTAQQKKIKRYNNPLERDKIIVYPPK